MVILSACIYATGFSNGEMFAHRLGAELPGLFAAISANSGTVGGHHNLTSPLEQVNPTAPMPVILIHGIGDTRVSYRGGLSSRNVVRFDLSFAESVALWVQANGCSDEPVRTVEQGAKGRVFIDT